MHPVKQAILETARKPSGVGTDLPSRVEDLRIEAGTQVGVVVGSVRSVGPNVILYADVPANWAAAGTSVVLVRVAGRVRAPLAPVVLPAVAGSYMLQNIVNDAAGTDRIDLELATPAPAYVPEAPVLTVCLASWAYEQRIADEAVW